MSYKVGQLVELADGRKARVRFVGTTNFSAGDWIGVELPEATGKNDGAVQGQRYFECDPECGLFLRPASIKSVLEEPKAKAKAPVAKKPTTSRQSIVGAPKTGALDAASRRRETLNSASPTPGARTANGTRSPAKPTVRSSTSTRASTPSKTTSSVARKPASTASSRLSISSKPNFAPSAPSAPRASPSASTSTAGTRTSRTATSSSVPSHTRQISSRSATAPKATTSLQTRPSRLSSVSKPNGTPAPKGGDDDASSSFDSETNDDVSVSAPAAEKEDEASQEEESEDSSEESEHVEPQVAPARSRENGAPRGTTATAKVTATSRASQKPPVSGNAMRTISELEAKIRVMEKRLEEDKEKLRSLERIQAERDRFEGIIQRLQTKYQPQQQELADGRRRIQELEKQIEANEKTLADHDGDMEMATLDREMAEETAEGLRTELEAVQTTLEELRLEVEVLREENQELSREMSPEERTSQGWMQIERSNERLREALVRLRDMSKEKEAELQEQIESQEADLKELQTLRDQYEEAHEKWRQSEITIDDLRQQLETATGAEDMLEELTGQNLNLSEQIEELKAKIDDLEILKELNDELEISHTENYKQLQDELDFKEAILSEQSRLASQQNNRLADYEGTISKFRELVTSLQSSIQEMQASQQISEAEAEQLNARSKAMIDLNMKLQTSAAKSQASTMDLELRGVQAYEAMEHLTIIQMFLPDGFDTERKAVAAFLRFKRVAAKSRVLHQSLRDKVLGNAPMLPHENIFSICDMLDKLVWISSTCDRFDSHICSCAPEEFPRFAGALHELDPVERSIDGYIESHRKNNLRPSDVAEELQRLTALLAHLAELHIPEDNVQAFADDIVMRTQLIQSYLENAAVALSAIRNLVPVQVMEDGGGEVDGLTSFQNRAEAYSTQLRSARVVAGKAVTALEELKARSMSLRPDLLEVVEQSQHVSARFATSARQLGEYLLKAFEEESDDADSPRDVLRTGLRRFCAEVIGDSSMSDPLASLGPKVSIAQSQMNGLLQLSNDLSKTIEFERRPAPWTMRAEQIKRSKLTSLRAEEEVRRLREEVQGHIGQLQTRNQQLEEQAVKIEVLESRTRDVNAKTNRITELQRQIEASKGKEKELTGSLEKQIRENQSLLLERDRWKHAADQQQASMGRKDTVRVSERSEISSHEVEALKLEIAGLQGAVRYLQHDERRSTTMANNAWLEEPLLKPTNTATQARQALARDGRDALASLVDVVASAQLVDLSTMPENKLQWRPAKEQARWQVLRENEKWQAWRARVDMVLEKGQR